MKAGELLKDQVHAAAGVQGLGDLERRVLYKISSGSYVSSTSVCRKANDQQLTGRAHTYAYLLLIEYHLDGQG